MFDSALKLRIQQANDIVDVIGEHLSLAKKGKDYLGLCPFHTDHKPSMNVSPSKQIFKCFACGAGGDVIKFIQMRENLNYGQALERLAHRAGIQIETRPAVYNSGEIDPNQIAKANAWALKHWQANLWNEQKGSAARKYLEQRHISVDIATKWGLGLAVDSWDDLFGTAKAAKGSFKTLEQAGLVVSKQGGSYYDKFRNRLMFPIWDVTGRVIAFGGRTLGNDPAKYMNSPATVLFDKSNSLYGLNFARHSIGTTGTAVVVEGYTDCMMPHQFGVENVVATLGTSLTAGHARMLKRYARKIVLIFDSDVAGVEAANRSLEVFLSEGIDIRIANVPEGKDPCDFVLAAGKEAFENVINNAVDVMEYKWHRLKETFGSADTLAQKKTAAEDFLKTTALAMGAGKLDALTRGLIITRLSNIIGLSQAQVKAELEKRVQRIGNTGSFAVTNQKVVSVQLPQGYFAKAQQEILEVLLNEPGFFERVRQRITVEMFDVPILRHIASILYESLEKNFALNLADIVGQCESVELAQKIVDLADTGEKKGNFVVRLDAALSAFEEHQKELDQQVLNKDDESLRQFSQNLSKTNLRNAGL